MSNPDTPPPSADSHPDTVAERVQAALGDAYRIDRELGGGGMSRVFLAHETSLDRDVVVKVLPEDVAEGLSRERFRREVLLSANLQHPNIAGVIAAGDAGGLPYFVMPYIEGQSLRAKLTADGAMSVPHTVSILRDVARALAFAHERGVVHRDIKPDNVLLAGGAAIVADFGVAKAVATARSSKEHPHGTLTHAGISLGTPAYMAPEQVAGDPMVDQRADLYALGVMAYEMLAGSAPFAGRSVTEIMQAHLIEVPLPLSQARPGIPSALAALVMRCLEKDPARRPAHAMEVLRVLDDPAVVSGAVSSSAMRSMPNVAPRRSRRRWLAGGIGAALLAAFSMWQRRPSTIVQPTEQSSVQAAPLAIVPPGVAVLPLVSISPDSSDAYLALGMTEEITSALSRVRGLRVASSSAAAAAQAEGGGVAEVAKRLGVPFLLEGTVQRSGDRLRVAVRLVTASDGFSAWSEVYERPTGDVLAMQADIAEQIAAAVRIDVAATASSTSSSSADSLVAGGASRDPEAYNQYLRGHYLLARRGRDSVAPAIRAFEAAIDRDPAFARAYAELAQAYSILPLGGALSRGELSDKALFAAERALALDSTLASAFAALGNIHNREWRWKDGREALQRAIALDSTDVLAHFWLGQNLLVNGDARGAQRVLGEAARRDPKSPAAGLVAVAQSVAGDRIGAVATARAAVARDSTSVATRVSLAVVLQGADRVPESIDVLNAMGAPTSDDPTLLGALGYAYGKVGRTADAKSIVSRLKTMGQRESVYPALAKVYLGLGDRDWAMDALTWATAARDEFFASESMALPMFDIVRGDPRFARVVGIVGLDAGKLVAAANRGAR